MKAPPKQNTNLAWAKATAAGRGHAATRPPPLRKAVFHNVFDGNSPAEVASAISSFVFPDKARKHHIPEHPNR